MSEVPSFIRNAAPCIEAARSIQPHGRWASSAVESQHPGFTSQRIPRELRDISVAKVHEALTKQYGNSFATEEDLHYIESHPEEYPLLKIEDLPQFGFGSVVAKKGRNCFPVIGFYGDLGHRFKVDYYSVDEVQFGCNFLTRHTETK